MHETNTIPDSESEASARNEEVIRRNVRIVEHIGITHCPCGIVMAEEWTIVDHCFLGFTLFNAQSGLASKTRRWKL